MNGLVKPTVVALAFWAIVASAWEFGRMTADAHLKRNERVRLDDLGELQKYREANSRLNPDPRRIVFYGDSITSFWDLTRSFPAANYLNRGVPAQTSADMLIRFRQDVVDLHPKSVVILAGVNDFLWRNKASDNDEQTLENLESNDQTMAELAELHHIQPIFASLLPIHNYTPASQAVYSKMPREKIRNANEWLQAFCAIHGYLYIDYYTAMLDEHGMLRRDLSEDGLHPNDAGYRIMTEVFSQAFHR